MIKFKQGFTLQTWAVEYSINNRFIDKREKKWMNRSTLYRWVGCIHKVTSSRDSELRTHYERKKEEEETRIETTHVGRNECQDKGDR